MHAALQHFETMEREEDLSCAQVYMTNGNITNKIITQSKVGHMTREPDTNNAGTSRAMEEQMSRKEVHTLLTVHTAEEDMK